jgi:hypothetical protein
MKLSYLFKLSAISSALALTGCIDSSDDKEEIQNTLPSVSITSKTVSENSQVTLTATANDSDGSINGYNWQLTSGQSIEITGKTTQSITFTSPSVMEEGDILDFTVSVTDNDGAATDASGYVSVTNVVPSLTLEAQSVNEKASIPVTANANGNGDKIVSYLWQQTSGSTVDLGQIDTDTLTFIAPEVSADENIGLSLTVTDVDNDSVTVETMVSVKQLTIPLTIAGLATDSPISNGEISVQVAGREITIDVTADANGVYSVDLVLDDSESDAFISIIAQGVGQQANAGLITLLGTAGQLSTLAGEDNTLTEDESFAVNVTNISTAQYALAKLANGGKDISTDSELELLTQALNYEEVLTLATAIKVAIDKSTENPGLSLPSGTTNTLDLVENIEVTQAYIQEVVAAPEFQEAQDEIFQDDALVDNSSVWEVPESYFILPSSTLSSGSILRFNSNKTGSLGEVSFTWQEEDGVITTVNTDAGSTSFEDLQINDQYEQIEVNYSSTNYVIKRLSSNDNSDILLFSKTSLTHYPNGELTDKIETTTSTDSALRNTATVDVNHSGSGVAYLPFMDNEPEDPNIKRLAADEFSLNKDGTGHATILNIDYTWQVVEGVLTLNLPSEAGSTSQATWKQLSDNPAMNQFAHEFIENRAILVKDDNVGEGAILPAAINWQSNDVAGIYTYDSAAFNDPLDNFWFELQENGEANTYSSFDDDADGTISIDELTIMPGSWTINSDGTLTITRVRHQGWSYTEECRYADDNECKLYHERTWRLLGKTGNAYGLFHKHDFKYSNLDWGDDEVYPDELHYDNRTVYKVDQSPVSVPKVINRTKKMSRILVNQNESSIQENKKRNTSTKFSKLEPGS